MIDKQDIAKQWISAWNQHDLEAIMRLYAEEIEHISPKIDRYFKQANSRRQGKADLQAYFELALTHNPSLHFELRHILEGKASLVLIYRRNGKDLSGEYLELNEQGLIIHSRSHYL